MTVHPLAPGLGGTDLRFYFACTECGWCSSLCDDYEDAARLGRLHLAAKAAVRGERR